MDDLIELTKARAGKKQSLTKKLSAVEKCFFEETVLEAQTINAWIQEIEQKIEDVELLNAKCKESDPNNHNEHQIWVEEIYSTSINVLNKLKSQLNISEQKVDVTQLETLLDQGDLKTDDVGQERQAQVSINNKDIERRISIEKDTLVGHLRRLIEKSKSVNTTATENQLIRMKDKKVSLQKK